MSRTDSNYLSQEYWQQRLSEHFDLTGVGHSAYSLSYNQWLYRRKRRCIEEVFEHQDLAGKRVMDIGCGTGFFVDWYLRRGAKVTGIDITSVAIEQLSATFDADFVVADITDPSFARPDPVDIVNMWDVIYHIVDPDAYERAIDNITRSLKPGGLFLFTDWFGYRTDREVAEHVRARCMETHREVLEARGFELASVYPLYRYLNKRTISGKVDNMLGRLYFVLDNRSRRIAPDNLSLGVWKLGN